MMNLPNISDEQQEIITHLKNGKNVIVDSVAGSGKTTTNLYIAKELDQSRILLLTYNSKLRIETKEKIKKSFITNLEVHTYHSFCVRYYDNDCYTDDKINKFLNNNNSRSFIKKYDLIILDETQDLNPLYFELVWKILHDIKNNGIQICVLGDRNQSIYDFNKADSRFITLADKIFTYNDNEWLRSKLHVSFRITNTMSTFINKCMLGTDRIQSNI